MFLQLEVVEELGLLGVRRGDELEGIWGEGYQVFFYFGDFGLRKLLFQDTDDLFERQVQDGLQDQILFSVLPLAALLYRDV